MKDTWKDLEDIWNSEDYRQRNVGSGFDYKLPLTQYFRGRWVWQGGVAILLFLAMLVTFQLEGPGAGMVQENLRYLLAAKESDMTAVLETMARSGAWLDPFDNQMLQKERQEAVIAADNLLGIPVSGRVSRGFGEQRSPIDNSTVFHSGIDILTAAGEVLRATLPGTVLRVAEDPYLGRVIELEHQGHLTSLYGNVQEVLVEAGQQVTQGEIIGKGVGHAKTHINTIHFEVRDQGQPIDPLPRMATVNTSL